MEPDEYTRLARYEQWYWWYVAQRETIARTIEMLGPRPKAKLLDAGCGTGQCGALLAKRFKLEVFGVDASGHAAALWNGDSSIKRCVASINTLPYSDSTFDLVLSMDVLDCCGVNQQRAVSEMARVLKLGGHVVLIVPAHPWLRSRHDQAVHSAGRFTRPALTRLLATAGLVIEQMRHLFAALLPLIVAKRLLDRLRSNRRPRSDLTALPAPLNRLLLAAARFESRITQRVSMPFGSSILTVARRAHP